jgi:hypothetical protein
MGLDPDGAMRILMVDVTITATDDDLALTGLPIAAIVIVGIALVGVGVVTRLAGSPLGPLPLGPLPFGGRPPFRCRPLSGAASDIWSRIPRRRSAQ